MTATPKQIALPLTRSTIEHLYSASFCISKDETCKSLNNILIDLDNSRIVAVDGYRLVQFALHENDMLAFDSVIAVNDAQTSKTLANLKRLPLNGKACKELKKLLKDKKCLNYSVRFETFIDAPVLIFQAQGNPEYVMIPISKLEFPRYQVAMPALEKIVPEEYTDISFSLTSLNDLMNALKLSQSTSDQRVEHIRLRIHKNTKNPILVNARNNSEKGYDGLLMPIVRFNP